MKRVEYIDALKGFAIVFVVIGHVANGYINQGVTNELFVNLNTIATAFHMSLFFTISGFLFARVYFYEDGSIKRKKLKNQVINLICLYFIFGILLWTSKFILSSFVNSELTVANFLMMPIKPFDIYWYIYSLVLYYIFFSTITFDMQQEVFFALLILALAFLSYLLPDTWGWLFGIKRFLYYLPSFFLGCCLSRKEELLNDKRITCFFLLIVIALFAIFWKNKEPIPNIIFVNLAVGLSTTLCLFCIFKQNKIFGENTVLSFIGRYCLEIYLLHTYFVTFCRNVFNQIALHNPTIIMLLSTILGVIAPIVIAYVCKKIGIYKYLFTPYKEYSQVQTIKK